MLLKNCDLGGFSGFHLTFLNSRGRLYGTFAAPKKILMINCIFSKGLFPALLFALFSNSLSAQVTSDSCWAFSIDAIDVYSQGPNIAKAATLSDGFVICGNSYRQIFPNLHGAPVGRGGWGGIYLAKYDFTGKLIWLDEGVDPGFASLPWDRITLTADAYDNIYICGQFPSSALFYYNGGASSVHIAATDSAASAGTSFIAKLNPSGNVIWHTSVALDEPTNITWSPNNQLAVIGNSETDDAVYIKGNVVDTISRHQVSIMSTLYNHIQFFYWLDTAGNLVKHTKINEKAVNYTGVANMAADSHSNVFVCGQYERTLSLPAAGVPDSLYLSPDTLGPRFYMAKYDSAGTPLWIVRDRQQFISMSMAAGTYPLGLAIGGDGTAYVATQAPSWYHNDSVVFYNSDNSATKVRKGPWIIYSIDGNGLLKWAGGGNYHPGGLCVKDSIVTGVAYLDASSPAWYNDTIYSANGHNLYYPVTQANVFIAKFDTAGNIFSAAKAGYSNGPMAYPSLNVIPGNNGSSIVYGEGQRYSGTDSIVVFNNTLNFNGTDGFVATFGSGECDMPILAVNSTVNKNVSLACYPNPIFIGETETAMVESDEVIGSMALYNLLGVKCGEWNNLNKPVVPIKMGNMPAGFYLLKCRRPDGTEAGTIKVILQ